MAKNKSRTKKQSAASAASKTAEIPSANQTGSANSGSAGDAEASKSANTAKNQNRKTSEKKQREILYQAKSKRSDAVIKAYITFTYRVMHPGVTPRLILYGLIIAAPGIFFFKDVFWKVFFIAVGAAMILLGFFRQYISLAITRKNDPDYKSGAEFTYNFTDADAEFLRNGEKYSGLDRYKDITNFYYDDSFYYLAGKSRDLLIIPKDAFTVGDAADFEDFIYKKSKHTCRWIPDNFRDRMKKRRAERAVASGRMMNR